MAAIMRARARWQQLLASLVSPGQQNKGGDAQQLQRRVGGTVGTQASAGRYSERCGFVPASGGSGVSGLHRVGRRRRQGGRRAASTLVLAR